MVVRLSPPDLTPARITVEQYHAMIQAGVFVEDESVELIEGILLQKMDGSPSAKAVRIDPFGPALANFTVEQYHGMIRCGALTEDDPIELIEGYLVQKMSRNTPHDVALQKLNRRVRAVLPLDSWDLRIQSAITLNDSEPEPDGAVVMEPPERYLQHHPHPEEIALVVEIAASSLDIDRGHKQRIYSRAGIAVYWIVNLAERQVEVYTLPQPLLDEPSYAHRADYREGESVPVVVQTTEIGRIAVEELLPGRS